ncbi:hypothetical protein CCP2SC5_1710002 [Azospirillaceae bacterium]
MSDIHAFFDRDVYLKLACCDIWQETIDVLGVTHPCRLESAGPKDAENKGERWKLDEKLQSAFLKRIKLMTKTVPVVPAEWLSAAQTDERYRMLQTVQGIDAGEAALVLVCFTKGN